MPELYAHDDVGQQVPHSLYTFFIICPGYYQRLPRFEWEFIAHRHTLPFIFPFTLPRIAGSSGQHRW